MPMPKTAVNEYYPMSSREHDIGRAGKIPGMESKPIPKRMEQLTNPQLGLRIAAMDRTHNSGSMCGREAVGHESVL